MQRTFQALMPQHPYSFLLCAVMHTNAVGLVFETVYDRNIAMQCLRLFYSFFFHFQNELKPLCVQCELQR